MYYLKYRSKTLSELDNVRIREQLSKILLSDSLPHAFLFAGPKGTGKTSSARIVAKILNAEVNAQKITTVDPDDSDANVRAITDGTSPDVIEMDAASHRKIDDVRELISELKFAPLTSKYKVYIIDEVHMLTKEAFNALLKSLEEPPASTIFILATTEADSLPRTITSRCVTVSFPLATEKDITGMIHRYLKGENKTLSDEVIAYIASHADGSFRDAAKILELAIMHNANKPEDIQKLLGHVWHKGDLLEIVSTKDTKAALEWIQHSQENGADFKLLIESLLKVLHKQLLSKNGIEVPGFSQYNFSTKECAVLISLLHKAYNDMKNSPIQSLPLEIAVIEFMET